MVLELPWPAPILFPNAQKKHHWTKVARVKKAYRRYCWAVALEAKAKGRIMHVRFNPPDGRARDDDGMIGAFKSGRDGIADATKIDDKHYRPTYEIGEPVAGGTVTVILGE